MENMGTDALPVTTREEDRTMKCQICKQHDRDWSWQPLGPDDSPYTFALPGSHYRGFPVIGVCDWCKAKIERKEAVSFIYRGQRVVFPEQPSCPRCNGYTNVIAGGQALQCPGCGHVAVWSVK